MGPEILKSCESAGYVGLAFYDSGARSIYAKKPIKTVADAKGLKIRVQQSDLWVALVSAMGANATPMPYGEVYTGLKTGLIDAAENNIPSFDTAKHVEAVKVYSKTEHSMAPEILVMSKVVWDKLPASEQAMIRQAAKESVAVQRKAWDEAEGKSLANVKALGAQIVDLGRMQMGMDLEAGAGLVGGSQDHGARLGPTFRRDRGQRRMACRCVAVVHTAGEPLPSVSKERVEFAGPAFVGFGFRRLQGARLTPCTPWRSSERATTPAALAWSM